MGLTLYMLRLYFLFSVYFIFQQFSSAVPVVTRGGGNELVKWGQRNNSLNQDYQNTGLSFTLHQPSSSFYTFSSSSSLVFLPISLCSFLCGHTLCVRDWVSVCVHVCYSSVMVWRVLGVRSSVRTFPLEMDQTSLSSAGQRLRVRGQGCGSWSSGEGLVQGSCVGWSPKIWVLGMVHGRFIGSWVEFMGWGPEGERWGL